MGEEFVSLDEATRLTGLSKEELDKRIAEGTLRSFLQEGEQVFRKEDILKLAEKAPEEEGIMELLEEGEELSLVPEEEEAPEKREGDLGATTIEKIEGEEAAPIEVPGLEEKKKEEEAEVVFEADEELEIEPAVAERPKPPEAPKAEEAPAPSFAAEVLEEMEETGEELAEKEMKELGEREEAPAYARTLVRPTGHPGFSFLLILSLVFLLISAIIVVNSVLGAPQSILKPFMDIFTR